MEITINNLDDGSRYYHNTYIESVKFEPAPAFYLIQFHGGGDVSFTSLRTGCKYVENVTNGPIHIEYVMPGKTLFQAPGKYGEGFVTMILTRKLDKQYKRGISSENSVFMELFPGNGNLWKGRDTTETVIRAFQDRLPLPTKEQKAALLADLGSKSPSRSNAVLSDMVTVTSDGTVCIYETRVGVIDYNTKLIFCNPLFYTEVKDAVDGLFRVCSYRSERRVA